MAKKIETTEHLEALLAIIENGNLSSVKEDYIRQLARHIRIDYAPGTIDKPIPLEPEPMIFSVTRWNESRNLCSANDAIPETLASFAHPAHIHKDLLPLKDEIVFRLNRYPSDTEHAFGLRIREMLRTSKGDVI